MSPHILIPRRTLRVPRSGLQVCLEPSIAWTYTDLGTTAVDEDTDPVGRWVGRQNIYNFDKVADGNRPAYRTSQLSGSGSGRCASFDGVDDYLKSTQWTGVLGAQTIAFRFRLSALPTNKHLYWARNANICDAVYFAANNRINARLGANANGNGRSWSVSLDTTAAHTAVITYDGVSSDSDSSYVCRYDGSALSFAAQSALLLAGTNGNCWLGSYPTPAAYFQGWLGPFCIWNRVLSAGEISQVEACFNNWS